MPKNHNKNIKAQKVGAVQLFANEIQRKRKKRFKHKIEVANRRRLCQYNGMKVSVTNEFVGIPTYERKKYLYQFKIATIATNRQSSTAKRA